MDDVADLWRDYADNPHDLHAKSALARELQFNPLALNAENLPAFLRLVTDQAVEPDAVAQAGWTYLAAQTDLFADSATTPERCAERLEPDELTATLLAAAPVANYAAEQALTHVRRWLLLSVSGSRFARLSAALRRQAELNQGAWLIEDDEQAFLQHGADAEIASLYYPRERPRAARSDLNDPVTRAVAEQYESWPYPQWTRVTRVVPRALADEIREWDPEGPDGAPGKPDILIAGCGTGRHAARYAVRYPDARITAIDISDASLRYAQAQCEALNISGIEFRRLDLHRLGELGRRFDMISCAGVLHHLPSPEAGWGVLVEALKPGGVLHIMVYSMLARLRVRAMRTTFADLMDQPRDGELLRKIRRRVIERFPDRVPSSHDFFTLGGVHDLFAHRHEDPFDIARIKRTIAAHDLRFLRFRISSPEHRARYRSDFPEDPQFRSFESWSAYERRNPSAFATMYDFACRKT